MTDESASNDDRTGKSAVPPSPAATAALPAWLLVAFVLMILQLVVSVSYAITMNGFVADDGYFLAYGSLCTTVPIVAEIDRFAPFFLAVLWLGCVYLGLTREPRFYRVSVVTSLVSIAYGALTTIMGPFSFAVGPTDFDPTTVRCGRWPRDITQRLDLEVLHLDWPNVPITAFGLSMIVVSVAIYVYLRSSKRVHAIYRKQA
jgi:hypothetical protein